MTVQMQTIVYANSVPTDDIDTNWVRSKIIASIPVNNPVTKIATYGVLNLDEVNNRGWKSKPYFAIEYTTRDFGNNVA